MKWILYTFFALNSVLSTAQSTQFANIYDVLYGNESGSQLLIVPDGYVTANIGICQNIDDGVSCSPVLKLNKSGKLLNYKVIERHLKTAPFSAIHNVNDTVYICGTDFDTDPYKWRVMKYDFDLDSIGGFEKRYFGNKSLSCNGMIIKGDYIYMVGKELLELHSQDKNFWIVKTDKQGNLIKKRQLDKLEYYEADNFDMSMTQTADGYFAVAYSSYQNVSSPALDGRREKLIKFDENLDTLWSEDYGLNWDHLSTVACVDGTRDGGLLYNTVISLLELYDHGKVTKEFWEEYGETQEVIHKMNGDGDILWSDTMWVKRYKTGTAAPWYSILDVHEMKNGDIVAVGKYKDYKKKISKAVIRRYTKDGKLKWEKLYDVASIPDDRSAFYKFREEENGDLVCIGYISYEHKVWNEHFIWVVRLDSMGCFESSCGVSDSLQVIELDPGFVTKTNEIISDYIYSDRMIIYPNPCSDVLNVKVLDDFHTKNISIFDMQGNIIMSRDTNTMENIDISKLKTGIYFIKLRNKTGRIKTGKFVKE